MKTWRFHEFGDLANLQLEEADVPEPQPGEALVKLHYAALNPADAYLVRGQYPRPGTPPFAVGRDGCGIIEKPAADGRFQVGDQVVVLRCDIGITRDGTLAEYVAVPEESLAPLPSGWTAKEGAAAPLVFLTAWQALVDVGNLLPGQVACVTGASGGVGVAAVMLARALGGMVVALSRSPEKRQRLKELGADVVLDTAAPDLVQQAQDALRGGRVDVVVENLGGPYLQKGLELIRERGRIAVVGLLSGLKSEVTVGHIIFKRARIEGVQVGGYTAAESQEAWTQIVKRLNFIHARPIVDKTFAMTQVQQAFAHLAKGPMGKVLIEIAQPVVED